MGRLRLRRGDLILVNLDPTLGAEINKTRPAIVVSNDLANQFSSLVTILPITSQKLEKIYPFEVLLENKKSLPKISKVKADQIRTLDKKKVIKKMGELLPNELSKLDVALRLHLNL